MIVMSNDTLPLISGKSLTGKEYNLPNDFEKELTLITIGFFEWQHIICQMWMEVANAISSRYDDFDFYQIPILNNEPKTIEDIVYGDLFEKIHAEEKRSRVITLTNHKEKILSRFAALNTRKVTTLLISKSAQGQILWRVQGFPTDEYKQSLKSIVHYSLVVESGCDGIK